MTTMRNVNTTDLEDALHLGCCTMCNVFNADDNDIPFFRTNVRPVAFLGGRPLEADIPGRHLHALLNAEDAIGVKIDEECIDKQTRALFFSYSGPVAFPLSREVVGGPLVLFDPHMPRQGLRGLCALVRYRDSNKARELAQETIATIYQLWDPASGWDRERVEALGLKLVNRTFISGIGRAIGPLVEYYRVTGYGPALKLAIALKEKAINEFFTEEGGYDRDAFGDHVHSTTCVMSSLAQLADLTSDSRLMNRVRAFYDNGLWKLRDELGWVIESTHPDANPDCGEGNNTADVLDTALILGRWGYTEYYHDAERILRCHLLPSQLRDVSFIVDPPNPKGEDGKRDVADRHLGAFGFPAPYGHEPLGIERVSFNMDVVGGVIGSLCEAYRMVTRFDEAGHWVNLLFDHETDSIEVESPYTHPNLRVRIKRAGPLFLRVPPWVDLRNIIVRGISEIPRYINGFLFFAEPPINRIITFEFPMQEYEVTLKHRTRKIRARLQGDRVVAMDNFGADLTYFPSID